MPFWLARALDFAAASAAELGYLQLLSALLPLTILLIFLLL